MAAEISRGNTADRRHRRELIRARRNVELMATGAVSWCEVVAHDRLCSEPMQNAVSSVPRVQLTGTDIAEGELQFAQCNDDTVHEEEADCGSLC